MTRTVVALSVVAVGAASAGAPRAQAPARTRSVYVSALTSAGLSAPGLTATDISIKEDDKPRPVVSVGPAMEKMSVVLLVDDSGMGIADIRLGVASFVTRLVGRAEFSLIGIADQNRTLVEFTEDEAKLANGLVALRSRIGPLGQHLMEALTSSMSVLEKREAVRPVIVVLTNQAHETGNPSLRPIMDRIDRSGAALYVVEIQQPGFQTGLPAGPNENMSAFSRDNDAAEPDRVRLQVLNTGPPATGGRYQRLVSSPGAPAAMRSIAQELLDQYVIVFGSEAKPEGTVKISLSTSKPGVTLRAPAKSAKSRTSAR